MEFSWVPPKFEISTLVIPDGVEEVHVGSCRTPLSRVLIEGLRLPSSVQSVSFDAACKFPPSLCNALFLPENSELTSLNLELGVTFTGIFDGMQWPASLTELKMSGEFFSAAPSGEQPDTSPFPPSLRVLDMSEWRPMDLARLRFPADLEVLHLPPPHEDEDEDAGRQHPPTIRWPPRLRVLHLPAEIREGRFHSVFSLPESLKELRVGIGWDQLMRSKDALPVGLEALYLYCAHVSFSAWPANLRTLHVCPAVWSDQPILLPLPPRLEEFQFQGAWKYLFHGERVKTYRWPSTLKRLILVNPTEEEWPQQWPPHLNYLELPLYMIQAGNVWRKEAKLPPGCVVQANRNLNEFKEWRKILS
jgi:hypothetical protein